MTAAKAVWGGVVAFVAPGATYLLANKAGGITGTEALEALLVAIVVAAPVAFTVYRVPND